MPYLRSVGSAAKLFPLVTSLLTPFQPNEDNELDGDALVRARIIFHELKVKFLVVFCSRNFNYVLAIGILKDITVKKPPLFLERNVGI